MRKRANRTKWAKLRARVVRLDIFVTSSLIKHKNYWQHLALGSQMKCLTIWPQTYPSILLLWDVSKKAEKLCPKIIIILTKKIENRDFALAAINHRFKENLQHLALANKMECWAIGPKHTHLYYVIKLKIISEKIYNTDKKKQWLETKNF